jgi:hypothetical protein
VRLAQITSRTRFALRSGIAGIVDLDLGAAQVNCLFDYFPSFGLLNMDLMFRTFGGAVHTRGTHRESLIDEEAG